MTAQAKFLIAQHVPDLFRREPRNIGVLVEKEGDRAARFVGESDPNEFDGRRLRSLPHAGVYRQWVSFWREMLEQGEPFESMIQSNGSHYRLLDGGSVSDTQDDSAGEIADYLHSLLVSDGGFAAAISSDDFSLGERARRRFAEELEVELESRNLLASTDDSEIAYVRHPVRKSVSIKGSKGLSHTASFAQENGRLYVMECIDFERGRSSSLKDHAGWIAFMFNDIKAAREKQSTETISLVRGLDDNEQPLLRYASELLLAGSDRVLDWDDAATRDQFLDEREAIASSAT